MHTTAGCMLVNNGKPNWAMLDRLCFFFILPYRAKRGRSSVCLNKPGFWSSVTRGPDGGTISTSARNRADLTISRSAGTSNHSYLVSVSDSAENPNQISLDQLRSDQITPEQTRSDQLEPHWPCKPHRTESFHNPQTSQQCGRWVNQWTLVACKGGLANIVTTWCGSRKRCARHMKHHDGADRDTRGLKKQERSWRTYSCASFDQHMGDHSSRKLLSKNAATS